MQTHPPIPDTVIRWGDISVRIIALTPDLAKKFQEKDTHNRGRRRRVVPAYAADMASGAWPFNGDAIRRSRDGVILDGGHRIASVIESGVTIQVLLVDGLDMPTQETMDDNVKRTFGDTLRLRGEINHEILAGFLWRITTWEMGGGTASGSNVRPTKAQKSATLEKYPWLRELAGPAKRISGGAHLSPSIVGFCWWMFHQINAEDAAFFFERLGDGQGLTEGDPVYELRRTLDGKSPNLANDRWLTAIVIKAWNYYRDGRSVNLYKFQAGGATPEAFPVPH